MQQGGFQGQQGGLGKRGKLIIVVERALNLPQGMFGNAATNDPYLKLRIDNTDIVQRGMVKEKAGNNPVFNESYTFDLQGMERGINVEIWDENILKNTELASVFLPIQQLIGSSEEKVDRYRLISKSGDQGGEIIIRTTFQDFSNQSSGLSSGIGSGISSGVAPSSSMGSSNVGYGSSNVGYGSSNVGYGSTGMSSGNLGTNPNYVPTNDVAPSNTSSSSGGSWFGGSSQQQQGVLPQQQQQQGGILGSSAFSKHGEHVPNEPLSALQPRSDVQGQQRRNL